MRFSLVQILVIVTIVSIVGMMLAAVLSPDSGGNITAMESCVDCLCDW